MRVLTYIYVFIACLFFADLSAQPIYGMSNMTVNDCEGILMDSQNGPEPDQYDHNEDYTFVICVPDADEIILNFDFFATEATYDVLTIYEGPDKTGTIIAQLDGVIQPAPSFVVKGECVTFHFVSDDNILANGWSMSWEVIIDEPKVPQMELISSTDCPMDAAIFQFDFEVDCDLINTSNFSLVGPGGASIASVSALDCDPVTNLATQFRVDFVDSLRISGIYRLNFEGRVQDQCGEWHDIGSTILFELSGCPIVVIIEEVEKACAGSCGRIRAVILGGDGGTYNYMWSHTPINAAEVEICAEDSKIIAVEVTQVNSASSARATYTYIPYPNPQFLNKIGPDTFCSSRSDHTYQVDITGGRAYSRIIPAWEQERRRYQFWRWNNATMTEMDIVEYIDTNGCSVKDTLWINPVNAGTHEAACVGAAAFQVNGGSPTLGTWSGDFITADGLFDPSTPGDYRVTYTAPNGCTQSKTIRVTDSIELADLDTICGGGNFDLYFLVEPFGGRWSGPEMANNYLGRIRANRLTPNQIYRYYYDLKGCRDSIDIFIEEISAGPNRTLCSSVDTLWLPTTGNWTGQGTYLPQFNAFDISMLPPGNYNYDLEKNGCTDRFRLTIQEVDVKAKADLTYCPTDEWIELDPLVSFIPGNGQLLAPFLKDSIDALFFNPGNMGAGRHWVQFEALGCSDSIPIDVEEPAEFEEHIFCEFDDPTDLIANPSGGRWMGSGILDPTTGLFDPQIVGQGIHVVTYITPLGCVNYDTVEVTPFEEASISGLDQVYCFLDTVIPVTLYPPGGQFYINGQLTGPVFNPKQLGTGSHELRYETGSGECASDDRIFITVLFPIDGTIEIRDDSLCLGESTEILVNMEGGRGTLQPIWDQGLGFGNSHIVSPRQTTTYTVVITDGCSEPFTAQKEVFVYPEFDVDWKEGPEVCFEDSTFIDLTLPSGGQYMVIWEGDTTRGQQRFRNQPGLYTFEVVEIASGCAQTYDVSLPGTPPIKANFSVIPNGSCLDIIDNELEVIDLARGYTEGTINYGDGTPSEDLLTSGLIHQYDSIGTFTITQIVENELGCQDSFSLDICVDNNVQVFIPNIFTPNDDDKNDVLELFAFGVANVKWSIYDRFGELVFQSEDAQTAWDGNFNGKRLNPGVFVLVMEYTDQQTGFPYQKTQSVTLIR